MRNQRSNFIPLPIKPARSTPKPLTRALGAKRSSSSQTERVVLVKEENLSFHPCSRLGHNDGGMRRDYVKAVNYINSCHKFINTIIEKNTLDKSSLFLLPMVTNFVPLFPYLASKKTTKREKKDHEETKKVPEKKISSHSSRKDERKSKSNFGVVKKAPPTEEAPVIDPVPVGDCEKNVQPQHVQQPDEKYTNQVADIVKEQIHQFFTTLQEDITKAAKKSQFEPHGPKCRNLDIVRQRLQELSKICCLQKTMESNSQIVHFATLPQPPPPPPKPKDISEDCSVILSDTDCEELKNMPPTESPSIKITCYEDADMSSLISESSDIKTDSDVEINT